MGQFHRSPFMASLPPTQVGTKWLCFATLGISLVASVTQRKMGVGIVDLAYSADAVLHLQLWRLVTYPFVESTPFGLLISLLVLWLFGRLFENQWGTRDFLRFFFVSAVGAGLLAIPLGFLVNLLMPFRDVGLAEGPGPCIDAMLVALALTAPNSNVLFGFVLPIKARTLIYILLGIEVISGIQTGAASLSITLGGMLMGYLLITGNWRPQRLLAHLQRHRRRRRSAHLHVVRPREEHRTLH